MKYSSTLKANETLTPATTRMNLEDDMLSEVSQTQKDKSCVIPCTQGTWNRQTHATERRTVVSRSWGKGNRS